MAPNTQNNTVLERGNIYFVYRPKPETSEVHGMKDVQRTMMILEPLQGKKRYRMITLGRKELPDPQGRGGTFWGFVSLVSNKPKNILEDLSGKIYHGKSSNEQEMPPARPAGEGIYEIVRKGDRIHLAYALELPETPGDVQQAMHIRKEESFILGVRNPDKKIPSGPGMPTAMKADFPERLKQKFGGRPLIPAEPDFLDCPGAEIELLGGCQDVTQELGVQLKPKHETEETAEVFTVLRLARTPTTLTPLFQGSWA
jgi:hypothetical protein